MSYREDAVSDAKETIENYREAIIDQLADDGEASDDLLNDYSCGDSYHHENHVDKSYDLQEAAQLLEELQEHEETDTGLWDGQAPRDAIATQAAFTYGNAVYHEWKELIDEINDKAQDVSDEYEAWAQEVDEKRERRDELQIADYDDLDDGDRSELDQLESDDDLDYNGDYKLRELFSQLIDEVIA